jgi:hypothetical protein
VKEEVHCQLFNKRWMIAYEMRRHEPEGNSGGYLVWEKAIMQALAMTCG